MFRVILRADELACMARCDPAADEVSGRCPAERRALWGWDRAGAVGHAGLLLPGSVATGQRTRGNGAAAPALACLQFRAYAWLCSRVRVHARRARRSQAVTARLAIARCSKDGQSVYWRRRTY